MRHRSLRASRFRTQPRKTASSSSGKRAQSAVSLRRRRLFQLRGTRKWLRQRASCCATRATCIPSRPSRSRRSRLGAGCAPSLKKSVPFGERGRQHGAAANGTRCPVGTDSCFLRHISAAELSDRQDRSPNSQRRSDDLSIADRRAESGRRHRRWKQANEPRRRRPPYSAESITAGNSWPPHGRPNAVSCRSRSRVLRLQEQPSGADRQM